MSGSGVPRIWQTKDDVRFAKEFELDVEDHLQTKYARIVPLRRLPFICAVGVIAVFAGLIYAYEWYRSGDTVTFLLVSVAFLAGGLLLGWFSYAFAASVISGFWRGFLEKRGTIGVPISAEADRRGVAMVMKGHRWTADWESFHAIEEDDRLFYFWISNYYAQVWPKRTFSDEEVVEFRTRIEEWTGSAPVFPPRIAGNVTPEY